MKALSEIALPHWKCECDESFRFGPGDPVRYIEVYFILVTIQGFNCLLRVSIVPGKLPLLVVVGKDALQKMKTKIDLETNYSKFPGIGDHNGSVCSESRAGHMILPLLPDKHWTWTQREPKEGDPVVQSCSQIVNSAEVHRAVRLPGSRVARDMLLSAGRESCGPLAAAMQRLETRKQEKKDAGRSEMVRIDLIRF